MSFVHPSWLLLLLILPMILLGAILTTRANNKAWQQLVAARLRKQLVKERLHHTSLGSTDNGITWLRPADHRASPPLR